MRLTLPTRTAHSCMYVAIGMLLCLAVAGCSENAEPQQPAMIPIVDATSTAAGPQATAVPVPGSPAIGIEAVSTSEPPRSNTPTPVSTVANPAPVPAAASSPSAIPVQLPQEDEAENPLEQGGMINLVSRQHSQHQDVHWDVSAALAAWGPGIVYSRLMRFTGGADLELPSLAVECELCSGWKMPDDTTFEFTLRSDVRWQDLPPVNARPLVAGDIAFSYERQRSEGAPNGALLHIVESIETPEDSLLHIYLQAPDADFLAGLADGHSKVVARDVVEARGNLRSGPTVGSGPWILDEAPTDSASLFRRNEDYFEKGAPKLERLRIHTIPDGDTAYAAFRVNNVDVHQLRPEEWAEFSQQKPDASMLAFKEIGAGLEVAFKVSEPPFDDLRARKAALLSMRPSDAVEEIWQGAAYLTQGVPLGEGDWLLGDEELAGYFDNRQRATELLADAFGILPVPVEVSAGDFGAEYLAHAERIAGEMQSAGFEPELNIVDRRRFGERVWFGGEYEMMVGPIAPVASPNGYMLAVLHSDGAWNSTEHRDEALDALILAQAGEYDPVERRRLVLEVQRHALENAYRVMPAAAVSLWAWWPHVKGFEPNFVRSEYAHWSRVWIER